MKGLRPGHRDELSVASEAASLWRMARRQLNEDVVRGSCPAERSIDDLTLCFAVTYVVSLLRLERLMVSAVDRPDVNWIGYPAP